MFDVTSPAEDLDIDEIADGIMEASLRKRLNVPVTPRPDNFPIYGDDIPLLGRPD